MASRMSTDSPKFVETLGCFRVWSLDGGEITAADWGREKAKTLLQYLITRRSVLTPKERIVFDLWPQLDDRRANRDFKVALNALMTALEPYRRPREASTYIQRQGSAYGLVAHLFVIDAQLFADLIQTGSRVETADTDRAIDCYRSAVDRYRGDYLPDALYEDWASAERERLLTLYLSTASHLATLLVNRRVDLEAIAVAEDVLARDPCWEEAYRVLMQAHSHRGNRPQVLRAYQRCLSALKEELGLEPMAATARLYHELVSD
jgi:LuxR family maltose regulon positive regulatory protein